MTCVKAGIYLEYLIMGQVLIPAVYGQFSTAKGGQEQRPLHFKCTFDSNEQSSDEIEFLQS